MIQRHAFTTLSGPLNRVYHRSDRMAQMPKRGRTGSQGSERRCRSEVADLNHLAGLVQQLAGTSAAKYIMLWRTAPSCFLRNRREPGFQMRIISTTLNRDGAVGVLNDNHPNSSCYTIVGCGV